MEFNKVIRGSNREVNSESDVFRILDAGFLCHVSFQFEGQTMCIPTAYGRKGDILYFHGALSNRMLEAITNGQTSCVTVTHLDGIVLARNMFHSSVNYRSVVLFGKATVVHDDEWTAGLHAIMEQIIPGRWDEVPLGDPDKVDSTKVVAFHIERASAKERQGSPMKDETTDTSEWSGHIPLFLRSGTPVERVVGQPAATISQSVRRFIHKNTDEHA